MIRVLEYSSLLLTVTPAIVDLADVEVRPEAEVARVWPSFSHVNLIGRLPSKIWHETADLMPSLSNLFGNRKGMMVGGAVEKRK